jgi:hypothetical protein
MALLVRRPWKQVPRRWCAALLAPLAVALVVPSAAADAQGSRAGDAVRIGGFLAHRGGASTVLASPPEAQASKLLGSDAFTVTVDGSDVKGQATRQEPGDLAVAIVVAAGVGAPDLKTAQDAAIETAFVLPKETRAAVIASGSTPKVVAPLGTDRPAAIDAIGKVERAPSSTALSALSLAADTVKAAPRQVIILFGPVGFVADRDVVALTRRLIAQHVAFFSISPNKAPKTFADAALATGGRSVASGSSTKAAGAAAAGQAIVGQLATQYRVSFTPHAQPTADTKIRVGLAGVRGSEAKVPRVLLPGGAATLGKAAPTGGRKVPLAPIAGAVVAVLLLATIVVVVQRRRRRRRSEPTFHVTATRVVVAPPAAETGGEPAGAATLARHRHPLGASPRTGQVDDALDRLEAFASRWQPRSQGIFYAQEALAIHELLGTQVSLEELCRATALGAVAPPVAPVVQTIEALRWGLVRRSEGNRWSDIAVEVAAVVRGELDPVELRRAPARSNGGSSDAARQLERLRGRPGMEEDVPLREPVRAAAIARERVLQYQWFGAESEIVSRVLVPVLLYDRAPAAVPYLGVSRHLGEDTDVSTFYRAATDAADEATRRIVQLRALRSRYQAELDPDAQAVVELLFSVPVVTAGSLSERLDASAATVTELMDHLVSAGVVEPVREPTRRGDPAWVAIEVLTVFESGPVAATVTLADPDPADAAPPDRATPRRRAAPARPRQLRARPRP